MDVEARGGQASLQPPTRKTVTPGDDPGDDVAPYARADHTWEACARVAHIGKEQCWGMSVSTNPRGCGGKIIFLISFKNISAVAALFLEGFCDFTTAAWFFDAR